MAKPQDLDLDRHGPADQAPTTMKKIAQRQTPRRSKIDQHGLRHNGLAVRTWKQPTGITWIGAWAGRCAGSTSSCASRWRWHRRGSGTWRVTCAEHPGAAPWKYETL
eukprot:4667151-Pyramimonas_sp.AAC.1